MPKGFTIGALIIRIGLRVYYTIVFIIRKPQNPILIIQAPTLRASCGGKGRKRLGLEGLRFRGFRV